MILPVVVRERFGTFAELRFSGEGVVLTYARNGPGDAPVMVQERIVPMDAGWERRVRVTGVPEGIRPVLAERPPAGARVMTGAVGLRWIVGDDRVTLATVEGGTTPPESPTEERPARQLALTAPGGGTYEGLLRLSVRPAP